jgi:hypothetical protein
MACAPETIALRHGDWRQPSAPIIIVPSRRPYHHPALCVPSPIFGMICLSVQIALPCPYPVTDYPRFARGGDLLCAYEGIMSNFNQSLSDGERDAPSNLEAGLRPFFKLRTTMPLQYITAFLLVALKEGQTVTELAARAGISASLMTRHPADLGQVNWYHKDGYDLIEPELIQWTVAQNGSDLPLKGSASSVASEVSGN